jgi:RNA polymerase sigma factor (sigma-70 family)
MTDQPDRLFERFRRSGDSEALGRVFDATAPRLLQLAIHLVGDIGAAEDLVQATFVTAIERAATFDASRSLDSWLAGILANHARDLKKAARREIDFSSLAERVESTPLEHALQTEWSSALAQALDGVLEPYRVVLILRLQHGMTPTEIAHALQRSPGAVRVQLHRGREMLRRLLPAGIVASALFIAEPGRGLASVKTNVVAHAALVKGGVGIAGVVGGFLMSTKVMVSIAGTAAALAALFLLRQRVHEPIETRASVESSAASLESSASPHDETLIAESSASPRRIEAAPPVTASRIKHVKLHGLVHDAETNEGIANAKVELFAPQPMRLSEVRRRWHDRLQVMDDGVVHGIGWPRFASELSDEGRLDAEDVVVYAPPVAGTAPIERAVTNAKGEFEITAPESLGCIVSSATGYTASIRALSPAEFNKANADELTVKIAMNIGNPQMAFDFQALPNAGVGLARLEFIINKMIGVHPRALLEFERLDPALQALIRPHLAGYGEPVEFFVDRLSEGIAQIACAFAPEPVIVRLSDFKSNEYANLLGGRQYEPQEENPMLGFRGAARYIDSDFRPCFELECRALRRVRNEMGLGNVQVMVPFVRTVAEARAVTELLAANGLKRGVDGLRLIMMCELPGNALLADDFLQYFDGMSIGSNDLTQLTLGVDRDSALVAQSFDERDAAVKALIALAIAACRRQGKYIGICGQGPSDHPDMARDLVAQGIDSISLNPDTVIATWLMLAGQSA